MRISRLWLLALLLCYVPFVIAQSDEPLVLPDAVTTNGEWRFYDVEGMSFYAPSYFDPNPESDLSFDLITNDFLAQVLGITFNFGEVVSLEQFVDENVSNMTGTVDISPVMSYPFGDAVRVSVDQAIDNNTTMRQVQYYFVASDFGGIVGLTTLINPVDSYNLYDVIFQQIMDSIRIDDIDVGWQVGITPNQEVTFRVPEGWQLTESQPDNGLSIIDPNTLDTMIVTVFDLDLEIDTTILAESYEPVLVNFFTDNLQATNIETAAFNFPIGDAMMASGDTDVELDDGTIIIRQQRLYAIMRGGFRISVNFTTDKDRLEQSEAIFNQVMNTLRWHNVEGN